MASGALTLAPLVITTASFWHQQDQSLFYGAFVRSDVNVHGRSDAFLPHYFVPVFDLGVRRVLGFVGAAAGSGIAVCMRHREALQANGSLRWFVAGSVLALAHLMFVPGVMGPVKGLFDLKKQSDVSRAQKKGNDGQGVMVKDEGTKKTDGDQQTVVTATKLMDRWLFVHHIRTWTVDVAAWTCFAVAALRNMRE